MAMVVGEEEDEVGERHLGILVRKPFNLNQNPVSD